MNACQKKKEKKFGGLCSSRSYTQQLKTQIMEAVKLDIRDWDEICYTLRIRGRELEERGLGEHTKDLERIRALIKEQLTL